MVLSVDQLTTRFKSIYMYLTRVLNPVWSQHITYRENYNDLTNQILNYESFLPALDKLNKIMSILNDDLCQQMGQEDHYQLLKYKGLLSSEEVKFRIDFEEIAERDLIELMEKSSLKSLKLFVRRCIDAIHFLEYCGLQGDTDKFKKALKKIGKEKFKDLAET